MRNRMKAKLLLAVAAILIAAPLGFHRSSAQDEQQPETSQRRPAEDPIQELQLTPEQRQQIRAIRWQVADERQAINRRLIEANKALTAALDNDNPDESVIEQRLRELSAAQAAQTRMRVMQEVRIRRVLTAEQRTLLRELRQAGQLRRPLENRRTRQEVREILRRSRNQTNSLRPRAVAPRRARP